MPGYVYYIDPILKAIEISRYTLSSPGLETINPGYTLTVDLRNYHDEAGSLFAYGVPATIIEIFNYMEENYGAEIELSFDSPVLNIKIDPGSYYKCERRVQVFYITNVGNATALCKWVAYLPWRPRVHTAVV